MTTSEFIFFGLLVVIIIIVSLLLGKALGRAQAVKLEIHQNEEALNEQGKEDAKALHQRVLKLQANVRVHVSNPEAFSDLLDFGDEDPDEERDDKLDQ
jgi:cell division protein FtsL